MKLLQHTAIQLDQRDIVGVEWSVPRWNQLAVEPAALGLVRHGGLTKSQDNIGRALKPHYPEHVATYLTGIGDERGQCPRTMIAWGSRNTFQNLGLPGWRGGQNPQLLARVDEPWDCWIYHAFCKLTDGSLAIAKVRFERSADGTAAVLLVDQSASDVEWLITGQPLLWDRNVVTVRDLAACTYDLRHLWQIRWESWQNCAEHQKLHSEMMHQFMVRIREPEQVRADALTALADQHGLPPTNGYVHSSLGISNEGGLNLLMCTGTLLEIGAAHRALGSHRAILLDNGGSVGVAYWSRLAWEREGWDKLRDRPTYFGNGSYFRPRGHSLLIAELRSDLPEGSAVE